MHALTAELATKQKQTQDAMKKLEAERQKLTTLRDAVHVHTKAMVEACVTIKVHQRLLSAVHVHQHKQRDFGGTLLVSRSPMS
eukprot:COSAG02_NODE_4702_length_5078_cov_2.761398_5_plen_83_part_00